MNKQKAKKLTKQALAMFMLPLLVYIVMMIVCQSRGVTFNIFSSNSITSILKKTSYMAIVALGIGFQLKYGRFDFSGGAIIVVSATVGGVLCDITKQGIWFLLLTSVLCGMLLSFLNSFIYASIRVPVSVCSLAVAYLFESFVGIILGGNAGPNILYREEYRSLGMFPMILIPLILAVVVYVIYDKFTVAGRQSILLRSNQLCIVNIGINEKKIHIFHI